jgi:hypothetical protein
VNPTALSPDETIGAPDLEGAMLIEGLVTAFVITYIALAVLGHGLLLQVAFTSRKTRTSASAHERPSHHAPIARARVTA